MPFTTDTPSFDIADPPRETHAPAPRRASYGEAMHLPMRACHPERREVRRAAFVHTARYEKRYGLFHRARSS